MCEVNEMYRHIVQYYETDKMGITHHSNYIRWMEEARIDFLSQIGWSYTKLEEKGIPIRLNKEYPLFYNALIECCSF